MNLSLNYFLKNKYMYKKFNNLIKFDYKLLNHTRPILYLFMTVVDHIVLKNLLIASKQM